MAIHLRCPVLIFEGDEMTSAGKAPMCRVPEWTACLVECQDPRLCELVKTARAVGQGYCSARDIDLLPLLAHQYLLWWFVSLVL
jgi:hypothetical protein